MLINKKIIHYFVIVNYYKNSFLKKESVCFLYTGIIIYQIFFHLKFYILNKPNSFFNEIYNFNFSIKAKYLFLLTIYMLYSKLSKTINLFFFKFHITMKKQQKFTILRAPCNHKNSKEQFGINIYSGKLKGSLPFLPNQFYSNYIISVISQKKDFNLSKIKRTIIKNAKKFNK